MDFALETTRSGHRTCRLGSQYLHSSYNPVTEAERFLESSLGEREAAVLVLSGPCLGYLHTLIQARYPAALILCLQFSPWFKGRDGLPEGTSWYPMGEESLESFLARKLEEELCPGLIYLEWPPAQRAFPAEAEHLRAIFRSYLERLAASSATTKSSGRRWILNACRSFLLAEELLAPEPDDSPIVVAASGPSLEEAAELLRPRRDRFRLFAVSSALAALRARGLEPDLVVATDGGGWSRHHLYPLAAAPLPLAAPLAALPSASLSAPLLLIDQGFFPESELCGALGGGIPLPSHGTVSGSALALAARLGSGPLIAAGLDLAAHGMRSHASPHGFDSLIEHESGRLRPLGSRIWERESLAQPELLGEGPWRSSRSLQVYAQALEQDGRSLRGRLFRLRPSAQPLEGFRSLEAADFERLLGAGKTARATWSRRRAPPRLNRESLLRKTCQEWIEGAGLSALGLAAGQSPEPAFADLFRAVDYPDWAAARRALRLGKDPRPATQALEAETRSFLERLRERLLP